MSQDVKAMSQEDIDRELKELELKAKRAELQDLKERLAEREEKRITRAQRFKQNGLSLNQTQNSRNAAQARCNHRKGGNGLEGVVGGQGDDAQAAVLKHQRYWGDIWVRCFRCSKLWKMPVKKNFYFEVDEKGRFKLDARGKKIKVNLTSIFEELPKHAEFDEQAYTEAVKEYQAGVQLNTRNQMSGEAQLRITSNDPRITDPIEYVREQNDNSNLD